MGSKFRASKFKVECGELGTRNVKRRACEQLFLALGLLEQDNAGLERNLISGNVCPRIPDSLIVTVGLRPRGQSEVAAEVTPDHKRVLCANCSAEIVVVVM
jgi:hypothetical protein